MPERLAVVIGEQDFAPQAFTVGVALRPFNYRLLNTDIFRRGFRPEDIGLIDQANLVVAEATVPTTTVCVGLAYAVGRNIPGLVFVHEAKRVEYRLHDNQKYLSELQIDPIYYTITDQIYDAVADFVANLPEEPSEEAATSFSYRDLEIDYLSQRVTVKGKPIHLTPTEYRYLTSFSHNVGRTLSHQEIKSLVWGTSYVQDDVVRVNMNRLRAKVDDSDGSLIRTRPGVGYIMPKITEEDSTQNV